MATPKKIQFIDEFKKKISGYNNFIFTDYRGLTVENMTDLRKKLYEKGVVYQVVKNNLVRIAFKDAKIDGIDDYLVGPTAIAFSTDDSVSPSKILVDFAKQQAALKVKGGFADGKVMTADGIRELSSLPSKEVLLSRLLGSLKSPASRLVSVLNSPIRNLLCALQEISKKK
ncbi:MAG: 50S ribosomal protein L10 [Spirochaetota bacterium]|nr:50S ribosomal protein L10 [Spirochaetota bacterium]